MKLRKERLVEHSEGNGQLVSTGTDPVPVRYFLDTWAETIATGSGTQAEMRRLDGFLWWGEVSVPTGATILETDNGQQVRITLSDFRSNRARFYSLG